MLIAAQPIVSLRNGRACGYELLARCRSRNGVNSSASFLSLLSSEGRLAVDAAILRLLPDACKSLEASAGLRPEFLSVNLFPDTISGAAGIRMLTKILPKVVAHLRPTRLVLEFHETLDLPWDEEREAIRIFHSLGALVAQDDHTNSDLCRSRHDLPWDWIKFRMGEINDDLNERIIEIRSIHKELPPRIVIEAPETAEQVVAAWKSDADFLQGYCTGAPVLVPRLDECLQSTFLPIAELERLVGDEPIRIVADLFEGR